MQRLFTSVFKIQLQPISPAKLKRQANRLLIVGFVLALTLPMAGVVMGHAATLTAENRLPAPPPKGTKEFSKQFDAYYADRTGGRRMLLRVRNRILLDAFVESPTPKVIIGTDNWLYLNTGFDTHDPKGDQEYDLDTVAKSLTQRASWCRERGIVYIVQVAREKHMVHPEHLPEHLQHSPIRDAVPHLKAICPEVTILDPLPLLKDEARRTPVYYRTDSHWNTLGVVMGYRQVAEELERCVPGYHGKAFADFTPVADRKAPGDLSLIMGTTAKTGEAIDWYHQPPEKIVDHSTDDIKAMTATVRLSHLEPQCRTSNNSNGVHLMILHDSFGFTFRDYFASDVAKVTAIGTYGFPHAWIDQQKPTVIVQQFVERAMMKQTLAVKD
ncbi:hypothetical protein BH11PLA2_BH11PLA2_03430 [soil metagenome]